MDMVTIRIELNDRNSNGDSLDKCDNERVEQQPRSVEVRATLHIGDNTAEDHMRTCGKR
jgi:hypothetical protein